jgi:hypothetical protein
VATRCAADQRSVVGLSDALRTVAPPGADSIQASQTEPSGALAFDTDGAGPAAQPHVLAQLVGVTALLPSDFLIA